ncbi:MAG: cation:proton antiporter, partial [Pseudomonadales bacterium]|nr:cation:proton antiporter [Pseudomonadales bacterium]
ESLLNDGTAIVLFTLFLGIALNTNQAELTITGLVGQFFWVVLLGMAIGYVIGWIALFWIGRLFNQPSVEIAISITSAYLAFFVAEGVFHVSGVVAVVTLAILFAGEGRTRISPEVTDFMHRFWETMAYIANTLIFLLVGILIANRLDLGAHLMWLYAGILYLGLLLIRGVSVGMFIPVLQRSGVGITREKALVLIWGGLRGAVALALALSVAHSDLIPQETRDQILFLCAGIVVLTIVINGTTMGRLLEQLGLNELPPAKQATVDKAIQRITKMVEEVIPELERDEFLRGANWVKIKHDNLLRIASPPAKTGTNGHQTEAREDKQKLTPEALSVAFRRQLLETERNHYWLQYKEGLLGRHATNKLVDVVEHALDGEPTLSPRPELLKLWNVPTLTHFLNKFPLLSRIAVVTSFRRMTLGYDIARGFINAQHEIERYIDTLAPSDTDKEAVELEIQQNKSDTLERIEQLRETFPEIISRLETNAAKRLLLNKERLVIYELIERGVLDHPEAKKLIAAIEERMSRLLRADTKFALPDPEDILRQLHWTKALSQTTHEQLLHIASQRIFSAGELLYKENAPVDFFAVILRGRVKLSRGASHKTPTEEHSTTVKHPTTEEKHRKLAGPGDLLGGMCLVTGIADHTAFAQSPVDVLWWPADRLKQVMAKDTQLANVLLNEIQAVTQPDLAGPKSISDSDGIQSRFDPDPG